MDAWSFIADVIRAMVGALRTNATSNPSDVLIVRMKSFDPTAASRRQLPRGKTTLIDSSPYRACSALDSRWGKVIKSCSTQRLGNLNAIVRPPEFSIFRQMTLPSGVT